MATRGGIAPHSADLRVTGRSDKTARPLTAQETAWLLLVPAVLAAVLAIALLGPPVGRLAFDGSHTYWPSAAAQKLMPKPTEIARYVLVVVCAIGLMPTIAFAAAHAPRMRPQTIRVGVTVSQLALVGVLVVGFVAQRDVTAYDAGDPTYFTPAAVALACAFATLGGWALTRPMLLERARRLRAGRGLDVMCAASAAALTVIWLLPSIVTDANVAYAHPVLGGHLQFTFDEALSVLDGRSPLVNMATYGSLVPYLIALPLAGLGASVAAFSTLMTALTSLALLAVYALLRRVTRSPLAALALYVPVLATSLFIVRGEAVERFEYGNYFGMFPIRYGGPYLIAWLAARHLDRDRPRSPIVLFAAAGLVLLNNTDFGLPALVATVAALCCAAPPRSREALLALGGRIVAGLAIALALVSLLTLLRAGMLPQLDRLTAYARVFGFAGYGNLPTPLLGFHLVVLATFVAALATATTRAVRRDPDATLTGMLAWCGVFGLGTGSYFAYRSHPDSLIASFSIWSLTLALLLVVVVRAARARPPARPSPATVALLVGCGLAVGSLAQMPLPWQQVERIGLRSDVRPLEWDDASRFVLSHSGPGAAVAILTALGHRIGYEAGVRNVTPYTGMEQMPTVEQLDETISMLRAEGGSMVFIGERWWPEVPAALAAAGFRQVGIDPLSEFIAWHDERPAAGHR